MRAWAFTGIYYMGRVPILTFLNIMLNGNLTLLSSLLVWIGRSYVCQCALCSHTSGEGANNTDRHIWDGNPINTLRPQPNGRNFPNDIFKCTFFNENVWISINVSLKFAPNVPISNIPALVQTMTWRRPAYKPLSEPMMVSLLTHICVTRPHWVN